MVRLIIFVGILFATMCTACSNELDRQLSQAEDLITVYPDSVKEILKGIDADGIRSDDGRMRVRLFGLYFRGQTSLSRHEPEKALADLTEALKISMELDDDKWPARIMQVYYDVYISENQPLPNPDFYSTDILRIDGAADMVKSVRMDLKKAQIEYLNRNYEYALEAARRVIDEAGEDNGLKHSALRLIGKTLVKSGQIREAAECWTEIFRTVQPLSLTDSLWLSIASVKSGLVEKDAELPDEIRKNLGRVGADDRYEFWLAVGDSAAALRCLQEIDAKSRAWNAGVEQYGIFDRTLTELELREQREVNGRLIWWMIAIVALALLTVGMAVYGILAARRRGWEKTEACLVQLRGVEASKEIALKDSQKLIRDLLKNKYETADRRCIEYYGVNKAQLLKNPKAEADEITGVRNFISELESDVNVNLGDLMIRFRSDLVGMKEADYRLFLCSVVDLSVITTAILLGEEKLEAVYNRKARLKNKIRQLEAEKVEEYMAYL